jgi:serine/threonine protein kinase
MASGEKTPYRAPVPVLEAGCFAQTWERKYYRLGNVFVKRSLRPREFQTNIHGRLFVPRVGNERLANEAATLKFIREKTNIPVPSLICDFKDDESHYVIMEYVEGIGMNDIPNEKKPLVYAEIREHLRTLHSLKSRTLGRPTGIVIPPYRVSRVSTNDEWNLKASDVEEYVFCHNDLSQQNIILDPDTFKIKAIIDWEYAGFFPGYFEKEIFLRLGHSDIIKGEVDDRLCHDLQT